MRDEILVSSNSKQRQQKTSQEAFSQKYAVNTQGAESQGPSFVTAQTERTPPETSIGLLEKMMERGNMFQALGRVERNQGAPGIDGMMVKDLRQYVKENWLNIRKQLSKGTYKPNPVRRVEIPKSGGGIRLLGIPTVLDRLIQQALAQVLTPIFDPEFSPYSYGFRPGKRAHDAIRQAQEYIQQGYKVVVDTDLAQFFDRINHDILMAKLARKVKDAEYETARKNLDACGWKVDYIISHCCPSDIVDIIGGGLYQHNRLTDFFEEISKRCEFDYWFFGHYHDNRVLMLSPFGDK